jgi:predicted ferric reductase
MSTGVLPRREPNPSGKPVGPAMHFAPTPRRWPITTTDVVAFLAVNVVIITAMWGRHNGLHAFHDGTGRLLALGQLLALYGTFLVLVQLVMVARTPWLDQHFGMDRLTRWHRLAGIGMVFALVGHTVFTVLGFAASESKNPLRELVDQIRGLPDVLAATVALVLMIAVAVTSMRIARRKLTYETWYFVHLYAYAALALGFAHQFAVGTDFTDDRFARIYWAVLYVLAVALLLGHRVIEPLVRLVRHRLRVDRVEVEAPDVVSLYLTGRALDAYRAEAGQFVLLRFLTRGGWWKAHPYSFSSAPNSAFLRLTVKAFGDSSAAVAAVKPGTRVMLEGPYGAFTPAARTRPQVLLIAGGIGITPIRALFEQLAGKPGDVALLYRASSPDELIFKDELDEIARARGFSVTYAVGSRRSFKARNDPFDARNLHAVAPGLPRRDVFICGPSPMISAALAGLRAAHVPSDHIHYEHFSF